MQNFEYHILNPMRYSSEKQAPFSSISCFSLENEPGQYWAADFS